MASAAARVQVSQILLLQDENATKAFIELSQPVAYKAFLLKAPDRAVVDIEDAELAPQLKLPAANGVVMSVRQGKTPTGLRVVFDLAQGAKLSNWLEVSRARPRLVVDFGAAAGSAVATVPEAEKPSMNSSLPVKPEPLTGSPAETKPAPVTTPVSTRSNVPGHSNTGYALMEDEIVQIDIDNRGAQALTTIQPASGKSPAPLPNIKPLINPTSAQSKPVSKKAKTVHDVFGTSARKLIIAIDAGHGGKDPGALGPKGTREKDVTLRVAKELAAAINADPGMRAVLIRDDDSFVPLQARYQKARRLQADVFVSIHADAAQNNAANGASVFVLSTKGASSQAARWLADKENAADLIGEGGTKVSLGDKDRNLSVTLLDMTQSSTMRTSEDVASNVLYALKALGKAHKKEVEHANFVVLRSPDVPSMLIETGFITNPDEERKLSDPQHRKRLAFAIVQGLRGFFTAQPQPGTYYARKDENSADGGTAATSGIIP